MATGGFDVVIGNPPYVGVQQSQERVYREGIQHRILRESVLPT